MKKSPSQQIKFLNGFTVETWWDRQSRNWITYVTDEKGYQVGAAQISGEPLGAELDKQRCINIVDKSASCASAAEAIDYIKTQLGN